MKIMTGKMLWKYLKNCQNEKYAAKNVSQTEINFC
jgi:hypothetical protein